MAESIALKKGSNYILSIRDSLVDPKGTNRLKVKERKRYSIQTVTKKRNKVAIVVSDKIDLKLQETKDISH